jgi:hypothetical protein
MRKHRAAAARRGADPADLRLEEARRHARHHHKRRQPWKFGMLARMA